MRKLASTCFAVTVVMCEGWSKAVILRLHNLLMNAKATSTARAQIEAMMAITAVREPSPDCWFSRVSAVAFTGASGGGDGGRGSERGEGGSGSIGGPISAPIAPTSDV